MNQMTFSISCCCGSLMLNSKSMQTKFNSNSCNNKVSTFRVRVSMIDSSSDFTRRTEQAWLISQQPSPIGCSSCNSKGNIECKWCGGTGFFILGDNMLCEVPSRNTSCKICVGKGSMCCSNCQGTGFRAKWLEEPPIPM